MVAQLFGIATLIVAGAIIADLVTHGSQTAQVLNGVSGLWSNSLNAVAGK